MIYGRTGWALATACLTALAPWAAVLGSEGGEKSTLFTGDLGNILWSLVTFVLVLVVLGRFAWRPILDGLQKRENFIRDSLQQAQRNRQEAEAKLKEYTDQLTRARAEATAIVEEGRRDAEVLKRKIEETAKAESAAMIERARREIGIATDTAVKELFTLSAKLAKDAAARIIRKELDQPQHERLIHESIEELRKAYPRRGPELEMAGKR
jgi:F-type H+-transporting ATPase subunit b